MIVGVVVSPIVVDVVETTGVEDWIESEEDCWVVDLSPPNADVVICIITTSVASQEEQDDVS